MVDLDEAVADKIVFLLGYPAKVLVSDSTHYNDVIAQRFRNLKQVTVDRVTELLALIDETRTNLDDTRSDANVSGVGEISLDPRLSDKYIYKQYRRYIRELSNMLDVPIRSSGGMTKVSW